MTDRPIEPELLMHKGRQINIVYVGGDYNGELKRMRYPIQPVVQVAKPPKYLGDNFYDGSIGALEYQTYHLRDYGALKYYVWSEWLEDWDDDPNLCLNREYESDNHRKFRLEEEQRQKEAAEKERQKKLAKKDFDTVGIAIEHRVYGRIDPADVRIFLNTEHPDVHKKFIKRIDFNGS